MQGATPGHWQDHSSEPSSPEALAFRAATLAAAQRPQVDNRSDFIVERSRRKRVLDIGCVAHNAARFDDPRWLHRRIADCATSCTGVDILTHGVQAMNERGFDVVEHDFGTGIGPFADSAPFDVIVAGELIEHLGSLDMLFITARALLAADGEMIITTPNPYAASRVWAGRRNVVHENVDHVCYLFPSGIAELAERAGLQLAEVRTTTDRRTQVSVTRRLKQWVNSSGWSPVGLTTTIPIQPTRLGRSPRLHDSDQRQPLGETTIYVIRQPDGE